MMQRGAARLVRRHAAAVALLAAVAVPSLSWRLADCPRPWFDEGLRTNMARTLLERGAYGTFTSDGLEPFPPIPSSGPLEIVAVAASFGCFGVGMEAARLPITAFALLAVLLLYGLAQWLWGPPAAIVAVLCVLAAPRLGGVSILQLGRQVMGETPSLALALGSLSLLFLSWRHPRRGLLVGSGVVAALAVLSKGQVAIGLLPALVAGAWAFGRRSGAAQLGMPLPLAAGGGAVGALWWTAQLTAKSTAVQEEHLATLKAQVLSHLLILGERELPRTAWLVAGVLLAGAAAGLHAILSSRRGERPWTARQCAELALVAFIAVTAAWFIALSNGWARYTYSALVLAELFLGRQVYAFFRRLRRGTGRRVPAVALYGGLAIAALGANLGAVARCPPGSEAEGIADLIREAVPREARIESMEWEVDALSSHWNFHHPPPDRVRAAVEQLARAEPFHIEYDALDADPAYLLKGPFSDWVRIYDDAALERDFAPVAVFGPYQLFRRRSPE